MSSATLADDRLDQIQPKILSIADYLGDRETFRGIAVEPYSPVLGATVRGLRLRGSSEDKDLAQFLHDRLLRYGFLQFEPGTVSSEDFIHLVGLFGHAEYQGTPYTPAARESSDVNTIDSKIKKTRMNFIWHIDQAFRPNPPRFTVLFGKTTPPQGGDTLFANATAAYDLLDPLFARYVETLTAVHDADTLGYLSLAYRAPDQYATQRVKNPPIEAPVVRVHPETGKKQIFVNELYTQRILGLSRTASEGILNILFEYVKSPDVQARFQWQEGSVLIWDNRTVQHRGVGDYGDGHRVLHRAIVQ